MELTTFPKDEIKEIKTRLRKAALRSIDLLLETKFLVNSKYESDKLLSVNYIINAEIEETQKQLNLSDSKEANPTKGDEFLKFLVSINESMQAQHHYHYLGIAAMKKINCID